MNMTSYSILRHISKLSLLLILFCQVSFAQDPKSWDNDIDFLIEELEIRHADLYHTISKDSLEVLISDLKSNLDTYSEKEFMFELARVLVSINDGHTGLFLPYTDSENLSLHRLPLQLRSLSNGTIVMNALPEYESLIGMRLTKIGGKTIEELLPELYNYIPRDNKYGPQGDAGDYLVLAELLEHLGVRAEDSSFVSTFEDSSGNKIRQQLNPVSKEEFNQYESPDARFKSQRWLLKKGREFWKEHIAPDLLYIQLNSSDFRVPEELKTFSGKILSNASRGDVNKIILDLRENHGGSIRETNPLLTVLISIDRSYPDKEIFVLISNNTFSAAGVLAARLEYLTDAVFVGSPTAWRPNSVGDIGFITLPNSKLKIRYSRLFIRPADEWNARPAVYPDFKAPVIYEHVINGVDPAIEVVKNYREKKGFADVAEPYLDPPDIGKLKEVYLKYKENRFNEFVFNKNILNSLAIELYRNGQIEEALELLELNAREYPWSPLAHTNLGEVLIEVGEKKKGMQHLKKAFELHNGYSKWRDLMDKQQQNDGDQ